MSDGSPWIGYVDVLNAIYKFEKEHPVEKYQYTGLKVWPVVRIWLLYFALSDYKYNKVITDIGINKKSKLYINMRYLLKGLESTIKILWDFYILIVSRKKTDILLYREPDNNKDRFIKPLYDIFQKEYNCQFFTIGIKDDLQKRKQNNTILFRLYNYILYNNLIGRFLKFSEYEIRKDKKLNAICSSLVSDINLYFRDIKISHIQVFRLLSRYLINRNIFVKVLSVLKPKVLLIPYYYQLNGLALISACKHLGIRSVDIQHGKMGSYQIGYTHWNKDVISKKGYDSLPDFFWVWGKSSKIDLDNWLNNSHFHKAIVGGYPWLSGEYGTENVDDNASCYKDYKKKILVTLQNLKGNCLPKILIDTINNSPSHWFWFLRFHPIHTKEEKDILIKNFNTLNANVDWIYSNKVELHDLLQIITHHVTVFSSSCIEAAWLGIPSILIDEVGKHVYENYFNNSLFHYVKTSNQVINTINKTDRNFTDTNSSFFIKTSKKTVNDAIKNILSSRLSYH